MRIISGEYKGIKLETLQGEETRPTTDRVKEGIFNAIQFDLQSAKILDLFAGSGQMGIEALSRGATHCTFIERESKAIEIIEKNIKKIEAEDKVKVVLSGALSYLKKNVNTSEKYSIVFLDPPYNTNLLSKALVNLSERLLPEAKVICEYEKGKFIPAQIITNLSLYKTYNYGKIEVAIYNF